LTIQGKGMASTIIDGNRLGSVIQILSGRVTIAGVTFEDGRAVDGGGGISNVGGNVTLFSVRVVNNLSIGLSGSNALSRDAPGAPGYSGLNAQNAEGGGILNEAGSLSIFNSVIESNQAIAGNGGNGGAGGGVVGAAGAPDTSGAIFSAQRAWGGSGGAGGPGGLGAGGGIDNADDAAFFSTAALTT